MTVSIQLFLDPEAQARVRALWDDLAEVGVPRLERFAAPEYRPHISIAVFDGDRPDTLLPVLRTATAGAADGLALPLTGLGFFLDPGRTLAYLGVAPSDRLLRLHRTVADTLTKAGQPPRPHYAPGGWTPHCTLPYDATDVARVAAAVGPDRLPIEARLGTIHAVHLETETTTEIITPRETVTAAAASS